MTNNNRWPTNAELAEERALSDRRKAALDAVLGFAKDCEDVQAPYYQEQFEEFGEQGDQAKEEIYSHAAEMIRMLIARELEK